PQSLAYKKFSKIFGRQKFYFEFVKEQINKKPPKQTTLDASSAPTKPKLLFSPTKKIANTPPNFPFFSKEKNNSNNLNAMNKQTNRLQRELGEG
ncbi:hypothetical protein L9G16_19720, partial [Shewanella sp. A25]|nr:hypothetical protein [Shewanella shenzhenensis]